MQCTSAIGLSGQTLIHTQVRLVMRPMSFRSGRVPEQLDLRPLLMKLRVESLAKVTVHCIDSGQSKSSPISQHLSLRQYRLCSIFSKLSCKCMCILTFYILTILHDLPSWYTTCPQPLLLVKLCIIVYPTGCL